MVLIKVPFTSEYGKLVSKKTWPCTFIYNMSKGGKHGASSSTWQAQQFQIGNVTYGGFFSMVFWLAISTCRTFWEESCHWLLWQM